MMNRPVVVRHWLVTVVVDCPECAAATVQLVGAAVANCPSCGVPLMCGGLEWDVEHRPKPKITIGQPATIASSLVS